MSWVGLYVGGLNPALALVPIVPFMPHARDDLGVFADAESSRHDTMNEFEHWWKAPVQVVLFASGLVNVGVPLSSAGMGALLSVLAAPLAILVAWLTGVMPRRSRSNDAAL